ncbi:MAG: hypothetical protein RLZZ400_561 [Actinomycetota bacterium]|jgi:uncharacterized membrane protein YhaH (DUF805 family)
MTFVDAIKSGFQNFANFRGRAGRAEFWYWALFYVLVSLVVGTVDNASGTSTIGNLVSLAFIVPNLAMSVRRFRDAGVNPWWLLLQLLPVLMLIWFFVQIFISAYTVGTGGDAIFNALANGDETAWQALASSPALAALFPPLLALILSGIAVSIFFLVVYLRPSIPGGETPAPRTHNFGDTTA